MPDDVDTTIESPGETQWPPLVIGREAPRPRGWLSGRRPRLRRWMSVATGAVNRALDRVPGMRWLHRRAQRRLQFTDVRVALRRGGAGLDGLRIAFVSDVHAGSYMDQDDLCGLFDAVARQQPDMVCLGGDLINTRACEVRMYEAALRRIDPPLGVFAVPGNHDHFWGKELGCWQDQLEGYGVTVLNNGGQRIERGGDTLWLAGVDDLTEGDPSLPDALRGSRAGEPIVLLSHHPDYFFEAAAVGVDLTLAGHTHGGQIAPFGHAPIVHSHFGYVRGAHVEVDSMLYVSRGAGLTLLPIWVGADAEVPVITLCRP